VLNRLLAALTWLHRWASVLFCLLLALWFASGGVMLFVPFPSISAEQRLAIAQPLDAAQIRVEPRDVLRRMPDAKGLRLISRDGAAAYIVTSPDRSLAVIDARSGESTGLLGPQAAQRIAGRYRPSSPVGEVHQVEYDQWTVHQAFDFARPWYRVVLHDASHTQLYISAVTGELGQITTRRQRVLNGVGAVLHWVYFTPLRRHWSAWDQLVWWLSLGALGSSVAGAILGTIRFVQARRRSGAGFRAFRGLWRWHHILGLTAGLVLLTWILSGWLSMDHQRLFSGSEPTETITASLRGKAIFDSAVEMSASNAVTGLPVREATLSAFAGQSLWILRDTDRRWIQFVDGTKADALDGPLVLDSIRRAFPAQTVNRKSETALDRFYRRSEEAAASNWVFDVGPGNALLFVDPQSGGISAMLDASRRRYSWLYFGLHSWRLPGVSEDSIPRLVAMAIALVAGFSLSITGVILAYRRVRPNRT